MFTSATLKDFNISLPVISPDTDASGKFVQLQDTGKVISSSHQESTLNSQVFIGANDSHIVLSMNSFGANTILSSKAKLGWLP